MASVCALVAHTAQLAMIHAWTLSANNATPMGGSAGRADGMVGAVEAQSKEGVLHLHLFFYPQISTQYCTVHELGDMLRREMLSVAAMKLFVSYVRCASYLAPAQHQQQRSFLEETWPAYSTDQSLARLPEFFWTDHFASGGVWKNMYEQRLQHDFPA